MGVFGSYPKSGLFKENKERENKLKNALGNINFKDLFMESLSPEFLKLFKQNSKLFYSQYFLDGICYEYGLMGKSMNKNEAIKIYQKGADENYDYICMYRLHRIFLVDYKDFGLERNIDLDRLYLYKSFAFFPFSLIDGKYDLLNKISIIDEINAYNDEFGEFNEFINFLKKNNKKFHLTISDIDLMDLCFKSFYTSNKIKSNIDLLNDFLVLEKGSRAYYEGQLKYYNFYKLYSGKSFDKKKIKEILNNLIKLGYYKAAFDYGKFLLDEGKYDEAKIIFKKGMDNSQQFCLFEYISSILREYNINDIMLDYNICSYIIKNILLVICFDKLCQGSAFYGYYYIAKHSKFRYQLNKDFSKYIIEIYKNEETNVQLENNELLLNNFSDYYIIDVLGAFGNYCYYGILDHIKEDKQKDLHIYKSRKYLYKHNKISLRKLNKTKEKLFRLYEKTNLEDLRTLELYNYYKLYKISVIDDTQNKLINIIKVAKNIKILYHFKNIIYKEKCKIALEKEISNISSLSQNNKILKNEI